MIKIRNHELDIDIAEELEVFQLDKAETTGTEIRACSPLRNERNPSFYINTETGLWKDFGSDSDSMGHGNLVKLLSHLNNCSYEETETYLLEKYNGIIDSTDNLELKINIQLEDKEEKVFTKEELKPYLFRYKQYLENRGISEKIQKKFFIGYWKEQKSIAFFWQDAFTGKVVNIKFRNINQKKYFYARGGQSISQHVYGLYQSIQDGIRKVYIVESEIDALYLWTHGIPAIAVGGSYLSAKQKRLLLLSGIETFVIATDDDGAGIKLKNQLTHELQGHAEVLEITLPSYANDINDVLPQDIKKVTDTEMSITLDLPINLHY